MDGKEMNSKHWNEGCFVNYILLHCSFWRFNWSTGTNVKNL